MKAFLSDATINMEPPITNGHGQSRLRRRRLGSHDDENDLLDEARLAFAPKNILVPLTLSSGSHVALAIAKNLALEYGAKLVLLHVVQLNIVGEERGIPRTRLVDEMCCNADLQLRGLASGLSCPATPEVIVREGSPVEAIVETAREIKADTILMCTHGQRGLLKWLHRNTALKVVRQGPCGVFVISPQKRGATAEFYDVGPGRNQSAVRTHGFIRPKTTFGQPFKFYFSDLNIQNRIGRR